MRTRKTPRSTYVRRPQWNSFYSDTRTSTSRTNSETSWHPACDLGHAQAVSEQIELGAHIDGAAVRVGEVSSGTHTLLLAAKKGNTETCKTLVRTAPFGCGERSPRHYLGSDHGIQTPPIFFLLVPFLFCIFIYK